MTTDIKAGIDCTCAGCGKAFTLDASAGNLGMMFDPTPQYCSKRCAKLSRKRQAITDYQHRDHMSIFDVEGV